MSSKRGPARREEGPGGEPKQLRCARTRHHGLGMNRERKCPTRSLSPSSRRDLSQSKGAGRQPTTRRSFLRYTALGTAGILAGPRILVPGSPSAAGKTATIGSRGYRDGSRISRIVRTYHPDATSGWDNVDQEAVDLMVHTAIQELTGIGETAAAWKSLFPGITADKVVGIKINLACGSFPTRPEVVNAIIDGLLMMDLDGKQLPEENIIVWDHDHAFFCPQTGYTPNWGGPGVQYVGSDHPDVGFDLSRTFTISHPHSSTSDHHPSRLLSEFPDYLINAAVIKHHADSDVTLCLKNHYGSYNNIAIVELHTDPYYGDGHTRGEPELNRIIRDELGDITKLFLIDGLYGLFKNGPGYIPPWTTPNSWAWVYNSFIVGQDPVAIDRIGTEKINEYRLSQGPPAVDPSHVSAAAQPPYSLGTDDLAEIDLVELDVSCVASVQDDRRGADGVVLFSPYPNPTRGASTLRFRCTTEADAKLLIADVRGRVVRRIASGRYARGTHRLVWDGNDDTGRSLSSGVYFCKLKAGDRTRQRRIVLIR